MSALEAYTSKSPEHLWFTTGKPWSYKADAFDNRIAIIMVGIIADVRSGSLVSLANSAYLNKFKQIKVTLPLLYTPFVSIIFADGVYIGNVLSHKVDLADLFQ